MPPHDRPGDAAREARDESVAERADRRWGELLQELRVAQTGVQILLGFLLSVAFTPRFAHLGDFDRILYTVTVVLGAAATGALIAPVSFHRFVFGRGMKPQTVTWASRLTSVGLILLVCNVAAALLLIMRMAVSASAATAVTAGVLLWFVVCWFAVPAWARRHARERHASGGPGR